MCTLRTFSSAASRSPYVQFARIVVGDFFFVDVRCIWGQVQLDTGSSDTWVDTALVQGAQPFKAANNTGVQTETCY